MPTFIDTHCHIFEPIYDTDRAECISRATDAGVALMLLPNVDSNTYGALCQTADAFPRQCLPMIGVHPTSLTADNVEAELEFVRRNLSAASRHFVGIGEIGMDLYWSKDFVEQQRYAFVEQLRMAEQHDLPLAIHVRNANNEAIQIVRQAQCSVRGVFHAFSGSIEQYRELKKLGDFKFGIGGVVTFKNAGLAQAVAAMDIDDMVLETDAPYLTPVPHRGTRNESSYIPLIAEKIAELKGLSIAQVAERTTRNAAQLFRLPMENC